MAIPLNLPDGTRLNEYDKAELDYFSPPFMSDCSPSFELFVGEGDGDKDFKNSAPVHGRFSIEPNQVTWVPKGFGYLFNRLLNLDADEKWYFAQTGDRVVIQHRLEHEFVSGDLLDLELDPGIVLSLVNLRVAVEPEGDEQVVSLDPTLTGRHLTGGRHGWRLDLSEPLRAAFADKMAHRADLMRGKKFVLREIVVFIPGDVGKVAATRPLRRLVLHRGEDLGLSLLTRRESGAGGRERLMVDLTTLKDLPRLHGPMAGLRLTPPDDGNACAVQLENFRFTGTRNRQFPLFALPLREGLQRWGGGFLFEPMAAEQLEVPGELAYLHFAGGFSPAALDQPGVIRSGPGPKIENAANLIIGKDKRQVVGKVTKEQATKSVTAQGQAKSGDRKQGKKPPVAAKPPEPLPLAFSSHGAVWSAISKGPVVVSTTQDLLQFQGEGGELHLDWPVERAINPETRLFVSLPVGAERISAAEARFELASGQTIQRELRANQALRLDVPTDRLRRIGLRLTMDGPYTLGVREAALFTPAVMNFQQAYRASFPELLTQTPVSELVAAEVDQGTPAAPLPWLVAGPGRLSGLVVPGATPLNWRTTLTTKLEAFRGIHLDYRVPADVVGGDACPIEVRVVGTKASQAWHLCPDAVEGTLFLPLSQPANGKAVDLGEVVALEWNLMPIAPPRGSARGGGKQANKDQGVMAGEAAGASHASATMAAGDPLRAEPFAVNFRIDGVAMRSAEQRLATADLFKIGGKPVQAALGEVAGEQGGDFLRQWRPLSTEVLARLLDHGGQIEDSDHPWFFVERIVAQPKEPLPLDTWLALTQPPPAPPAPSRWPKLLVWLVVLGLIGIGWWRNWWGRGWTLAWRAARGLGHLFINQVLRFLRGISRAVHWVGWVIATTVFLLLPLRHPLALMLGLFGLWQAGSLGLNLTGILLTIASLLAVVVGWMRWRDHDFGLVSQPPALLIPVLLLIVPWWLGFQGLGPERAWEGALVAAVLYWDERRLHQLAASGLGWIGFRLSRLFNGLKSYRLLFLQWLRLCLWGALTAYLYQRGMLQPPPSGENYAFTFGGMAAVLALRAWLLTLEPLLRRWFPAMAEPVYRGAGSLYFTGALVMLVATAVSLSLKYEDLAEQLAVIVYYHLVVGTVKELVALRRRPADADEVDAQAI